MLICNVQKMNDNKIECAVCLEILEIEDKATTECGHEFHIDCIKSLRNPTKFEFKNSKFCKFSQEQKYTYYFL